MNRHSSSCCDLKLLAFDAEDLEVVSAHVQDSCVRVGDMAYLPQERRFALVVSRFDWQAAECGKKERCRTGLRFERVISVRQHGVPQGASEAVLNLLAIRFEPGVAPSGWVVLEFSAGAAIRIEVECLEAAMSDLGHRWQARHRPRHRLDGAPLVRS